MTIPWVESLPPLGETLSAIPTRQIRLLLDAIETEANDVSANWCKGQRKSYRARLRSSMALAVLVSATPQECLLADAILPALLDCGYTCIDV